MVPSLRPLVRGVALMRGMVLVLALAGTAARADLHFEQTTVDAGTVRAGAPLAHRFRFVNRGPDPVEVTDTRPSCGCLTPHLERRTYPPGEEGALLVEVNTLSQGSGPQTWRVRLCYRSGAATFEIPLHITARVLTEITVQPAALTVFADSAVGHELTLTDLRPRPLAITEVRASSPHVKSRVTGDGRDPLGHQVRKISLEVTGDFPEGRHDEALSIYTDDPGYPELKVPVTVVKRSRQRLAVRPSRVTLVAPPGQPAPARMVLVQAPDNRPVVVERVEADDPAVACRWAPGPGAMATVKVEVDRNRVRGETLQATVRIHVSKPAPQEVTVPVLCTLQ
jgi:hypothetical protein